MTGTQIICKFISKQIVDSSTVRSGQSDQSESNANIGTDASCLVEAPLRLHPDAYSWANCKLKLSAVTKKVYDPNNIELDFSDPRLERRL